MQRAFLASTAELHSCDRRIPQSLTKHVDSNSVVACTVRI